MPTDLDQLRQFLLSEHHQTVCSDRLKAISSLVDDVVKFNVAGAFVEVGCYKGAMALWLRALLDDAGDDRQIHVYDSFSGLPEPGAMDSDHLSAGELTATPHDVLALHATWRAPSPVIHIGWFSDTLPTELPDQIALAYLDGDFYESIMKSLQHCIPRLAPGGVLIVDDYADLKANPKAWNGLPGVKRACDDFFGADGALEVIIGDDDLAFGVYRAPA